MIVEAQLTLSSADSSWMVLAINNSSSPNSGTSTEVDSCGYCGGDDSEHLYPTTAANGDRYSFRSCRDCEAVFLAPRPTSAQLDAAYSSEYYGTSDRKFIAPVESLIDRFRSARSRRVAKHLPRHGRVLDIGCGNGGFLHGLAKLGFEAHGIELPGGSAVRALQVPGINVHVGRLADSPYRSQVFNAVTLWHVFEHLDDPRDTLESVRDMLAPGGRLFLSLPNPHSWQARLFKGDWLHHDPPRHLFYLGPDALKAEAERLGLTQVARHDFSLEQNPFGIVQSVLNVVLGERDVLFESLKGNHDVLQRHSGASLWLQKIAAAALLPACMLFAVIESLAGRGGTVELVFEREQTG